MSAQPARHLALVDTTSGEVVDSAELAKLQAEVEKLRVDLKMAQRDVKAKNRRIAELERDQIQERLEYERREDVERIAKYWWRRCRNEDPRVQYMSPDRFDLIRELLDMQDVEMVEVPGRKRRKKVASPHYRLEDFKAAIDGAWFDAYEKARKNGSLVKYDDLKTICKDAATFDEFIKKAPKRRVEKCPGCGRPADHRVVVPDAARAEVERALARS